jgi:catechol 2,3-dioxygenase-like lactoylglutathione lyase family enzyme
VLGLTELPKPGDLTARGGLWLAAGSVQLHLGVDRDFRPARKAHPALAVRGLAAYVARARHAGVELVEEKERDRAFLFDPFGNRIELIQIA